MKQQGFTLIEFMIVVVIIGILAVISIPAYNRYTIRSANKACLYEVKAYTDQVIVNLNDNINMVISKPPNVACLETTDASSYKSLNQLIIAKPRLPGNAIITCDLTNGGNCYE